MLQSWILACRPKTLTAAVVPILVGTALAQWLGRQSAGLDLRVRWDLAALALISSLWIQIGTNLVNDASDFEKGADTHERLGPKRATQSGLLSQKQVWLGAGLSFVLAILFALPLVWAGGWPIVLIGAFSLIAGYGYTAGPFPLAYLGLGDLFVLIFFGWVAVGGMAYLGLGENANLVFSNREAWIALLVAGTQVGLLATSLIAVNNLRDIVTDKKAGKKTLAVRLGEIGARFEILFLILAPFLLSGYWVHHGLDYAAVLPWILSPLGFWISKQVFKEAQPGKELNSILAQAALLHLAFGILLSVGVFLSGR